MKKVILFFSLWLMAASVYGQAQGGSVMHQKVRHDAAVIELPYAPDMVNAVLNEYLSKKGKAKGEDLRGFTTYRNTAPLQDDSVNADLYFKVERKSRKEKESSLVSLLLRTPAESNDAGKVNHLDMEEAKTYLNELVPAFVAYDLEASINEQNKSLIDAEAKLKDLQRDQDDLKNKLKGLEKDLEKNTQEQQRQTEAINNQKQKLAHLVGQRKN